eukprot:3841648-Amphidinium_carterae.1
MLQSQADYAIDLSEPFAKAFGYALEVGVSTQFASFQLWGFVRKVWVASRALQCSTLEDGNRVMTWEELEEGLHTLMPGFILKSGEERTLPSY